MNLVFKQTFGSCTLLILHEWEVYSIGIKKVHCTSSIHTRMTILKKLQKGKIINFICFKYWATQIFLTFDCSQYSVSAFWHRHLGWGEGGGGGLNSMLLHISLEYHTSVLFYTIKKQKFICIPTSLSMAFKWVITGCEAGAVRHSC